MQMRIQYAFQFNHGHPLAGDLVAAKDSLRSTANAMLSFLASNLG